MKKPSLSIAERRKKLKEEIDHLKKREAALAAKQSLDERKIDTRRKIILGGAVLAHAAMHPDFDKYVRRELKPVLSKAKDKDRAVIEDWLT